MPASPTSQALTPTDEKLTMATDKLEELMDAVEEADRQYRRSTSTTHNEMGNKRRAARAALREYVSATTLTEDEANAVMAWCYNSQPTADMSSSSKSRNSACLFGCPPRLVNSFVYSLCD